MNKSHLGNTDNPNAELVTVDDIGKIVEVANVGKGFLRYVGTIHGKEGMFCGVELLEANGKHDGSYQGISYFVATPQHGIFAPVFRVSLEKKKQRTVAPPPVTDPSILSNGSWSDIGESMLASNCTFTVRKGPLMSFNQNMDDDDDDDINLMNVPMIQSVLNVDREALRREEQLQSSMVLGESRIGVEHLPIIEDEAETPLVETKPLPGESQITVGSTPISSTNPFIEDLKAKQVDEEASREVLERQPSPSASEASTRTQKSQKSTSTNADGSNKLSPSTVETPRRKAAKTPPEPVQPKFPVKPKAPSKHQLMMEQLKASIEAEKNRPKKEIKSRVSLLPPPAPKQKENKEGEKVEEKRKSSMLKQPLKAVNETKPVVERPKKERKPLYVPPPPKERTEKEKKVLKPTAIASTSKKEHPTSSFAGKSGSSTPARKPSLAVKAKKPVAIDEKEKLRRLKNSNNMFDVMAVIFKNMIQQNEQVIHKISKDLEAKQQELAQLSKQAEDARRAFESDIDRLKTNNQAVLQSHAQEIEKLHERHDKQMSDKLKEFERIVEDEKTRCDAEMLAMSNRHQKVVAALDEKVAEAEKQCEQLRADKKSLQAALANDCDQRNVMLTKEISSLQTALEMKSAEMKELRQKNQNLSLQVDEIPLKELEISKWKHKAGEYKQMLDQKILGEKNLVQQIEEMRRRQMHDEEEKEEMRRQFDLIHYKYENGDETNVTSFCSAPGDSRFSTPTKVPLRSRSSASANRPTSMTTSEHNNNRLSTCSSHGEDHVLNRSTLSMYTSSIRLPENHADDVIYAPDEIISSRTSAGDVCEVRECDDAIMNQSDSGIGLPA